jgi:hypothetical protein
MIEKAGGSAGRGFFTLAGLGSIGDREILLQWGALCVAPIEEGHMAEVRKVVRPVSASSPRPCAFVSPDKGNAPTITPARQQAETVSTSAEQRKECEPA